MQTVELLPAGPADAEAVYTLTHRCFIAYAEKILKNGEIEALSETLADVKRDIEKKHVIKCMLDGKMVGSVRYEILEDGIAYLTRFGVNPEIQSLGIGSLLIEKVAGECVEKGVKAITLFTAAKMTSSVAFYMKHGYYVHSITRDKGYIRAFLVKELVPMDELYDFEKILK